MNHGPWPLALGPSRSPPRDHPAVVLSQTHPLYSGHAAAAWDPVRVPCSMLIILSDSITHSSNRIVRTIEHLIYTLDFLNQLPCVVLVVLVKCATPGWVPQAKHLAGERIAISLSNHKLFYFNKQTLEIYSFFAKNVEKMPTMALPTGCWPSLSQNNLYVMGHGSKMNSFRMFFTIIGHHNCRMLMIFDEVCMDYYKKM